MSIKTLDQRIEKKQEFCGGKPHISGHRITVQNIAIWHDRLGWSADEIANQFNLDLADIYAALAYYFAHRKAIDQSIEDSNLFIEALKKEKPSKLQEKLRGESE